MGDRVAAPFLIAVILVHAAAILQHGVVLGRQHGVDAPDRVVHLLRCRVDAHHAEQPEAPRALLHLRLFGDEPVAEAAQVVGLDGRVDQQVCLRHRRRGGGQSERDAGRGQYQLR